MSFWRLSNLYFCKYMLQFKWKRKIVLNPGHKPWAYISLNGIWGGLKNNACKCHFCSQREQKQVLLFWHPQIYKKYTPSIHFHIQSNIQFHKRRWITNKRNPCHNSQPTLYKHCAKNNLPFIKGQIQYSKHLFWTCPIGTLSC